MNKLIVFETTNGEKNSSLSAWYRRILAKTKHVKTYVLFTPLIKNSSLLKEPLEKS